MGAPPVPFGIPPGIEPVPLNDPLPYNPVTPQLPPKLPPSPTQPWNVPGGLARVPPGAPSPKGGLGQGLGKLLGRAPGLIGAGLMLLDLYQAGCESGALGSNVCPKPGSPVPSPSPSSDEPTYGLPGRRYDVRAYVEAEGVVRIVGSPTKAPFTAPKTELIYFNPNFNDYYSHTYFYGHDQQTGEPSLSDTRYSYMTPAKQLRWEAIPMDGNPPAEPNPVPIVPGWLNNNPAPSPAPQPIPGIPPGPQPRPEPEWKTPTPPIPWALPNNDGSPYPNVNPFPAPSPNPTPDGNPNPSPDPVPNPNPPAPPIPFPTPVPGPGGKPDPIPSPYTQNNNNNSSDWQPTNDTPPEPEKVPPPQPVPAPESCDPCGSSNNANLQDIQRTLYEIQEQQQRDSKTLNEIKSQLSGFQNEQRVWNTGETALSTAIKGDTAGTIERLGDTLANGGLGGTVKRLYDFLQIDRVLNVLIYITVLHNAFQLSTSVKDTLFSAVNNVLQVFGLTNADGSSIDANEVVNDWLESFFKSLFGEENYNSMVLQWKKWNRVYQAASNIMSSIQSIQSSMFEALESIGSLVARIGNGLRAAGSVLENAFGWMTPSPNYRQNKWMNWLNTTEDAVSQIESISSEVLSITETTEELTKQKEEFDSAMASATEKPQIENTEKKTTEDANKAASESPDVAQSDLNNPNSF